MNRDLELLLNSLRRLVGNKAYFRDIENELREVKEISPQLAYSLRYLRADIEQAENTSKQKKACFK